MDFIEDKHIAFEASKLYHNGSNDPEYNWRTSTEMLSIFPQERPSLDLPSLHSVLVCLQGEEQGFAINIVQRRLLPNDSFSITNSCCYHRCRETFEKLWLRGKIYPQQYKNDHYTPATEFYFGTCKQSEQDKIKVPSFIRFIETQKLNITNLTKFVLMKEGAIKVIPSDFWSQQTMRFSLFTILLRAGYNFNLNYDAPNFHECYELAMKKSRATHSQLCYDAIYKFMDNNIWYTGGHNWETTNQNWIDAFTAIQGSGQSTPGMVDKLFVKTRPPLLKLVGE